MRSKSARKYPPTGYWMFLCNPKQWNVDAWLSGTDSDVFYRINNCDREFIKPGHVGILRVSEDRRSHFLRRGAPPLQAGIYAIFQIVGVTRHVATPGDPYSNDSEINSARWRAPLQLMANLLHRPVLVSQLPSAVAYEKIRRPHQASTIPISEEVFRKICSLARCSDIPAEKVPPYMHGVRDKYADAATRMAMTASSTSKYSNGQLVPKRIRNKEFRFPSDESLREYILTLVRRQRGRCAISGLKLLDDNNDTDPEMHCSLDRIDSHGHYEQGNLQVVCRFINRWKSSTSDGDFRRLVKLLRQNEPALVRSRRIRR